MPHEKNVVNASPVLESWQDPVNQTDQLFNLASGSVASKDVKDDCFRAKKAGEDALMEFLKGRLSKASSFGFYDITSA